MFDTRQTEKRSRDDSVQPGFSIGGVRFNPNPHIYYPKDIINYDVCKHCKHTLMKHRGFWKHMKIQPSREYKKAYYRRSGTRYCQINKCECPNPDRIGEKNGRF